MKNTTQPVDFDNEQPNCQSSTRLALMKFTAMPASLDTLNWLASTNWHSQQARFPASGVLTAKRSAGAR